MPQAEIPLAKSSDKTNKLCFRSTITQAKIIFTTLFIVSLVKKNTNNLFI